ncbi:hypothetical protein HPB50_007355 [Hyalomma asiaticum]|uniref:Uncharacterized protein n=1 Tax=Hyalomma asiaticum TaxID=266040 RepID=A0ACB7STY8_HYAAI|nr:hypothetical protein HPB50_007355 [Hyalomma asiaticum]
MCRETLRAHDRVGRAAHRLRRLSIGTPDYLFGPPRKSHHLHRNVVVPFDEFYGQFTTTATVADTKVGYVPDSMMWTTIPSSNSRPELPQTFKSAGLAAAVARREQARNALMTASRRGKRGKNWPLWRPQPSAEAESNGLRRCAQMPNSAVPRRRFPENGAGRALIAHLGATATRLVTFVLVREQNLMLVYTSDPLIADKLIGDILHVRRLGTSHKVRLTFSGKVKPRYVSYDALLIPVQPYKKTVPACSRCGSVGHRPDT